MGNINKYIIIVDDNSLVLSSLKIQLHGFADDGYQLITSESAEEAMEILEDISNNDSNALIPLIITDYQMHAMNGSELLIHVNEHYPETKKILLTGQADFDGIKLAIENVELFRYMQKPWEKDDLLITVKKALSMFSKERQLEIETKANLKLIKNLEVVNQFSKLIQISNTIEDVVCSICKNTITHMGYENCAVFLKDDDNKKLFYHAITSNNQNSDDRISLKPIEVNALKHNVREVVKTGKPLLIGDTSKDERFVNTEIQSLSELTVPIIHDNKVIGIICSGHSEKNQFPKDHLEILTTISSMTATKLMQVKYNEKLIQHQTHLEELVSKRTKELSDIYNETEENLSYAGVIQSNLIDTPKKHLAPLKDLHLMYRPLHKVSGDFYVILTNDAKTKTFIAVGDCVGHGVSGAFLTMFFLYAIRDMVTHESNKTELNELFVSLEKRILKSGFLGSGFESHATSDLSLLRIDLITKNIEYASNNNNLLVYDPLKNDILKPYEDPNSKLTKTEEFSKNIRYGTFNSENKYVAMFSDGIIDQFGGENFKKLKRSVLYNWIKEGKVFNNENCHIDNLFDEYKGDEKQIDDCIWMSFRL